MAQRQQLRNASNVQMAPRCLFVQLPVVRVSICNLLRSCLITISPGIRWIWSSVSGEFTAMDRILPLRYIILSLAAHWKVRFICCWRISSEILQRHLAKSMNMVRSRKICVDRCLDSWAAS